MLAATRALAELARDEVPESVVKAHGDDGFEFGSDYLIPKPFDPRVLLHVSPAVAKAADREEAEDGPRNRSGFARAPVASRGREGCAGVWSLAGPCLLRCGRTVGCPRDGAGANSHRTGTGGWRVGRAVRVDCFPPRLEEGLVRGMERGNRSSRPPSTRDRRRRPSELFSASGGAEGRGSPVGPRSHRRAYRVHDGVGGEDGSARSAPHAGGRLRGRPERERDRRVTTAPPRSGSSRGLAHRLLRGAGLTLGFLSAAGCGDRHPDEAGHADATPAPPRDTAVISTDSIPAGLAEDALRRWRKVRDALVGARSILGIGDYEEGPAVFGEIRDAKIDQAGNILILDTSCSNTAIAGRESIPASAPTSSMPRPEEGRSSAVICHPSRSSAGRATLRHSPIHIHALRCGWWNGETRQSGGSHEIPDPH